MLQAPPIARPPTPDAYYYFIAWLFNKACFVLCIVAYPVAAILIIQTRTTTWDMWRAGDVFYTFPEIAAGAVAGVQPA